MMAARTGTKTAEPRQKRVFSPGFRWGIVIYGLVFVLIAGAALLVLWKYMEAFERSQAERVVEEYVDALGPEQVTDVLMTDLTVSAYEDTRAIIAADYAVPFCAADKMYFVDIKETAADRLSYIVFGGAQKLLRIELRAETGGAGFGRNTWHVAETVPADGWLAGGYSVQYAVPEDARLMLNGNTVQRDAVILTELVYPGIRPSEQQLFTEFDVYRVSGLLREPEVTVLAADGSQLALTEDIGNLTYYVPFAPEFHAVTVSLPQGAELYAGGRLLELTETPSSFYYPTGPYEDAETEAAGGYTYVMEGFMGVPELEATLRGKYLELNKPDDNTYVFAYPESELYSLTLSVPRGAEVRLNGHELTEPLAYQELPGIRFNNIGKYVDRLPEAGQCELTGFYARPEVSASLNGQPLAGECAENEKTLAYSFGWPQDGPDETQKAAILSMTEAYLTYVSQGRRNLDDNYSRVLKHMVSGSEARERMANTYESYYWVNGYKETLERQIDIVEFTQYSEDLCCVTVSFYIHTLRNDYDVESSGRIRMVFVQTGSGWRAGTFDITL